MPSDRVALTDLPELSDLLLRLGKVRLRVAGRSMAPTLKPGDAIAVQPVPIEALRTGDLILFEHEGQLVCHRLVGLSDDGSTLLTRGDATSSPGERIGLDRVLAKVVAIRKRTVLAGLKEALQSALVPVCHRWLPRLQRLMLYRILLRPLVAPFVSYHLGLAEGSRWYRWHALESGNGFPQLSPLARPHLLLAKRGKDVVGWGVLSFDESAWQCEEVYIRLRYRGLGVESDVGRLARLILDAQ